MRRGQTLRRGQTFPLTVHNTAQLSEWDQLQCYQSLRQARMTWPRLRTHRHTDLLKYLAKCLYTSVCVCVCVCVCVGRGTA